MMRRLVFVTVLAVMATPSLADDLRDLCPDRPGRLTPACIVDAGHVMVELGAVDYTRSRTELGSSSITSTMLTLADTEVRLGLTRHLEAYVEWSPYNRAHTSQQPFYSLTSHGVGDVEFGFKQSIMNPDGKGVSVAIQPFAIAPIKPNDAIGDDDWTAGLIIPVTVELPQDFQIGLSPEIDWRPDASGNGHHVVYTGAVGLSRKFGTITPTVELYVSRDPDPQYRYTTATVDLVAAWVPKTAPNLQFDAGAYIGLNRDTPDVEVLVGVARRF